MTDTERLDIIDFCDAAGEWGSIVPIPAREADRMIALADQRRIAELEERLPLRDARSPLQDGRPLRAHGRQLSRDDRQYFEVD
ncbi:uncharacterized protein K460DRAFT_363813 [Cucurbitaria berberidis CBS 394.84]|uniref:Uncharacterized protein n=1 Tax=Cucurbitaria berberidis CBS 394.84 TaxID=1168544 RepID=A0A9P4LA73_9PLEO|nr:uncharacterized protein K460DRAFT_363813 [Cucurbitaria berberidis CBS 394.84]KAF1847775.1 hypothetical protein K460DRAFT_363813 [Cucurbitaria berberidis CBS 394.84]